MVNIPTIYGDDWGMVFIALPTLAIMSFKLTTFPPAWCLSVRTSAWLVSRQPKDPRLTSLILEVVWLVVSIPYAYLIYG